MQPMALVVDDEPDICELLTMTLRRMEVTCHTANNLAEAHRLLAENRYDFCLTDMRLPDGDGLQLVAYLQNQHTQQLPIAVITAHGNMDCAIRALKLGAFDFVSKPVNLERLRTLVQLALKVNGNAANQPLPDEGQLQGVSTGIQQLRRQIDKVARSDAPVYISGEPGSGKETVARAIHARSARSDQPFVPVNCGAVPAEQMESELFGHKRGSFSAAHRDKQGLLETATGGTVFLDEVADLPLDIQVKLLRAIQEKSVRPIGANVEHAVDVRILSATHKDLAAEVAAGRFRSDLFYRINVIEIGVLPLRERTDDIPVLAQALLQRIAERAGRAVPKISEQALRELRNHPLPGNVRQLENILERAYTLSNQQEIVREDLLLDSAPQLSTNTDAMTEPADAPQQQGSKPAALRFDPAQHQSLDAFLQSIEREALESALAETRWNRTAAAQKLGISFRSLRYRLKKLGLED